MGTVEEQFRVLFARSHLPMWMYDSQTLRFLAVSDSPISRYGYSREEFLQMRITDIRPPEDVANLRRILEQRSQGLRKSGSVRHRFKNGVVINVRITSLPTQLESRDAILVIAEDITGDERATAALKESEERFRSAFEHAAISMLITALNGQLLRVNRCFAEMIGYSEEELLTLNFAEITDQQDQEASIQGAKDLLAARSARSIWRKGIAARMARSSGCTSRRH